MFVITAKTNVDMLTILVYVHVNECLNGSYNVSVKLQYIYTTFNIMFMFCGYAHLCINLA